MQKRLVLVLLLACSITARADELDAKISLEIPAVPVSEALSQIGGKAGVALRASALLAAEPVVVRADNAVLRDLMGRIAECLQAEWQKESDGYRLIRSAAKQRSLADEELAARAKLAEAALARVRADLAKFGAYSAERAKQEVEREQVNRRNLQEKLSSGGPVRFSEGELSSSVSPALYTLQNLLLQIPARTIAELSMPGRVVFAVTPTAMQRPMPAAGLRFLQAYAALHNEYVKHMPPPEAAPTGPVIQFGGSQSSRPLTAPVAEAFLILTRFSSDAVTCTLQIGDATGAVVAEAATMLNLFPPQPESKIVAGAPEPGIELSTEARHHASLLRYVPPMGGSEFMMVGRRGGGAMRATVALAGPPSAAAAPKPAIEPKWKEILLHPERFDPLRYAASEFLIGAAKAQGRNLVASLPDAAAIAYSTKGEEKLKPSDVWRIAELNLGCRVELADGWAVLRPSLVAAATRHRLARIPLGTMLRTMDKDGRLGLDGLGAFLKTRSEPLFESGVGDRYVGLLLSAGVRPFRNSMGSEFAATKLMGLFDPMRRRMLHEGGRISLGQLSPDERSLVYQMVFSSQDGPNIDLARNNPERGDQERSVSRFAAGGNAITIGGGESSLAEERTEHLPGGLPSQGYLTIDVQTEPVVLASAGSEEGQFFSAEELGMARSFAASGTRLGGGGTEMPSYDRYRPGRRVSYTLVVGLSPFAELERFLRESFADPASTAMPYEQLPEAFRRQVDDATGRMRFGGPPPPPGK